MTVDMVNHPPHYNNHPSGVEVIFITREMFLPNLANAFKYIARHMEKGKAIEDLEKAIFYIRDQIENPYRNGLHIEPRPLGTYLPSYAPFYRYIADEPDSVVKEVLILIWDADKMVGGLRNYALEDAIEKITERIRILKLGPAGREHGEPIFSEKPVIARFQARAIGRMKAWKVSGDLDLETVKRGAEAANITLGKSAERDWWSIEEVSRGRGGIVWIKVAEMPYLLRYKPLDELTIADLAYSEE